MTRRERAEYNAWKQNVDYSSSAGPTEREMRAAIEKALAKPSDSKIQSNEPSVVSEAAGTAMHMTDLAIWGVCILAAPFTCGLSLIGAFIYTCARADVADKMKK